MGRKKTRLSRKKAGPRVRLVNRFLARVSNFNFSIWKSFRTVFLSVFLVHNPRRMIAMLKNTAKEDESGSPAPSDENTETELAKYMSRAKLFKSIEAAYTVLLDLELMVQEELR